MGTKPDNRDQAANNYPPVNNSNVQRNEKKGWSTGTKILVGTVAVLGVAALTFLTMGIAGVAIAGQSGAAGIFAGVGETIAGWAASAWSTIGGPAAFEWIKGAGVSAWNAVTASTTSLGLTGVASEAVAGTALGVVAVGTGTVLKKGIYNPIKTAATSRETKAAESLEKAGHHMDVLQERNQEKARGANDINTQALYNNRAGEYAKGANYTASMADRVREGRVGQNASMERG